MAKKSRRKRDRDGVRKRKDCSGRYEIQWQGIDPKTGRKKRYREVLETKSYKAARLERAKRLQAVEGGPPQPVSDITLNHFTEQYLEAHKHQKDIRTKRQRIENSILPVLGDRPLVSISVQEYEAFRSSIVGQCDTNEQRAKREKTANRYMSALKHMISWGVDTLELVPEEALMRVRRSKQRKESAGRLVFFYLSDVLQLVEACSSPGERNMHSGFLRPMILLGLGTGIRRGDLLKLRWRDVDRNAGIIHVGGDTGTDTKGGSSYQVEIGGIARLGLDEALRWLEVNGQPGGRKSYVIDWRSRDRVVKLFQKAYVEALDATELSRSLIFYTTRHTFGTWALAHGESIVNVQKWMGHASITTTQRYAHAVPRGRIPKDTLNPMADDSDLPFREACGHEVSNVVGLRTGSTHRSSYHPAG